MDKNKLGIYVHIPFCIKKCNYCDFNSYSGCYDLQEEYFSALFSEIKIKSAEYKGCVCDTVYIGGGTPTSVKTSLTARLLEELYKNFSISENAEITVECNPKTAGRADFSVYRSSGINRLSIGMQSADNGLLEVLGRIHKDEDFEKCLFDAREAGFENISADLMFALPGQSLENWKNTLLKAVSFGLSHISCYALKIEKETPFYNMKLDLPDDDLNGDMYDMCVDILKKNGYERYEISNFAKTGKKSRHNLKYWSHMPYIGLGAGAYSSLLSERFSNETDLRKYIKEAKNGDFRKKDFVSLSKNEQMSEFMFMGLRKTEGVSLSEFEESFGVSADKVFEKPIKKYLKSGVLSAENGRLYINEKLLYISNSILCDFV